MWNKVPIELQQEIKEITDGSVQELLMKLLRAESAVAERKRCSWETAERNLVVDATPLIGEVVMLIISQRKEGARTLRILTRGRVLQEGLLY